MYLQQLFEPKKPQSEELKRSRGRGNEISTNNCGVHTIIYIMNHCNSGAKLNMSTPQIDENSIRIRAWLIKMIVEGLPERMSWVQSLKAHLNTNMEYAKWFCRKNLVKLENTPILAAVSTLFPDRYTSGDAIKLAVEALNFSPGPDAYLADILLYLLPLDRIMRIMKRQIKRSSQRRFNKILIPINAESIHWYLGVLLRNDFGEYQLQTQNNCANLRNVIAEDNLRKVGNILSRLMRQRGESNTPLKFQHRRQSNFSNVQDNSENSTQNGRPRQIKNKYSRCILDEINNSQEDKELEYQSNSQSLDQVNYGTQPEERRESFEDYDWEQERMIRYRRKNNEIYRL